MKTTEAASRAEDAAAGSEISDREFATALADRARRACPTRKCYERAIGEVRVSTAAATDQDAARSLAWALDRLDDLGADYVA